MMPEIEYGETGWPELQWFGESWGAPVCEHAKHAETPTGAECGSLCGDPIGANDQGLLVPFMREDQPPTYLAHHRECFCRHVGLHE